MNEKKDSNKKAKIINIFRLPLDVYGRDKEASKVIETKMEKKRKT